MDKQEKESGSGDLFGGTLNILGLKIDLGELLTSPEEFKDHLERLRERLQEAGGRELLTDDAWRQGGATVTGHIRTGGLLGEQEYHIGTTGKRPSRRAGGVAPGSSEVAEPPIDVFDEGEEVRIVADVPGMTLEDLELQVEGKVFSLSAKATARRSYAKHLRLEVELEPDSLRATCRNGVLEVHLRKREKASG